MALSLSNLKRVRASSPPRILIYGESGQGKTTLASEFPNPVFLQIEDGTPAGVELNSFGIITNYRQIVQAINALLNEDHDFKTIVIDSITELQKIIFEETCERGDYEGKKKDNIEAFGYGRGYLYAEKVINELLNDGLRSLRDVKQMNVILIAHSTIERFDDPESISYNRYVIDINQKIVGAFTRAMDCIFLLKNGAVSVEVEKKGFNQERAIAKDNLNVRLINAVGSAAFIAKNRYQIPSHIRYDLGKGYEVLAPYFPNQKQNEIVSNTVIKGEEF